MCAWASGLCCEDLLQDDLIQGQIGHELRPDLTTAYTHPDVIAAVCVSEDNRRYLSYAFPALRLIRIHYSIDPSLFGELDDAEPPDGTVEEEDEPAMAG